MTCDPSIRYNIIRYKTIRYSSIPYNIIRYNTIQYSSIPYNIIQYNTIQYNTIQYNYNTIPCNCKLPITRNIDKIVILTASNKSVSPNSLEAQCYCASVPQLHLSNPLKSI